MKLSDHLDSSEVVCRCGCGYGSNPGDLYQSVIDLFEQIRHRCGGKPIHVDSACRCVAHNKAIGGAADSAHTHGLALDLQPPDGFSVKSFAASCDPLVGNGGLGEYDHGPFVHVDTATVDPSTESQAYHKHRRWNDQVT